MDLSAAGRKIARFGLFEADLEQGVLTKRGLRIRLQDQPFQVLVLLLDRPGEIVTREEIRQRLWAADTYVEFDDGLNTAIKKLRVALSDNADNPRFIETVPRRGYRFLASVTLSGPLVPVVPADWKESPENGWTGEIAARQSRVAIERASVPRSGSTLAFIRRRGILLSGAIAALLLVTAVVIRMRLKVTLPAHEPIQSIAPVPIRSIAVLPLENLTGDPGQQYFADGMTDALITNLAQIGSLRVISRTSTMHCRDSGKTLPQIAQELDVDAVVEGSVARSGSRVRIDAQLIQAPTDRHLWARSYERDMRDVLALQSELTRTIASEVQARLTPNEQARLRAAPPINPEAYEAYLRGRYYWNKRTEQGFSRAIDYFSQASEKDRNYALAYAGTAESYILLGEYGLFPAKDVYDKARAATTKALELDDTVAEAHNALAMVKADYDWDWPGAEREFKRAIQLNPSYATAHQWYGELLSKLGRYDEALAEITQARRLDPLSLIINSMNGYILLLAGQDDLAIEQLRKTLEIDPTFAHAHWEMGIAQLEKGALAESILEFQRATRLSPDVTMYKAGLGHAYARTHNKAEARKLLNELKELSQRRYVFACDFAAIYSGLDDKDRAFEWLDKAQQQHDITLTALKTDPLYAPLRSDPRFQDMLRRIGLPL